MDQDRPASLSFKRGERVGALFSLFLCLVFFLTLIFLSRAHPFGTYATETDFYQLYAPDAARLAHGEFPTNTFQGPGYPLALAFVKLFAGDYFVAGKWISMVSATLVGWLVFALFRRLCNARVGCLAQVFVFLNPQFSKYAISATTDMFFLMLCVTACVILLGWRFDSRTRIALAAIVSALAYLTRYNGIFLLVAGIGAIAFVNGDQLDWRPRITCAALFLFAFALVIAPWLYANGEHNGAPFYNTNYLNIATEFYPQLADDSVWQEGTRKLAGVFHSFADVIRYDPQRIITHYPRNLYDSMRRSIAGDLMSAPVGWAALAGLAFAASAYRKNKTLMVLLAALALYYLILALTHWEARYYLFPMVVACGLAAFALWRMYELCARVSRRPAKWCALIPASLALVMCVHSFALARNETRSFLASHPQEVMRACEYFRAANISGARLVGRKPHIAYLCAQQWIFFPPLKSYDELREWLRENEADYLTISSVEIARRKEFAALKDPRNAPPWLTSVWTSTDPPLVIYHVERDRLERP